MLSPDEAPYLFKEGKAQWASTSAELLASFVALFAFGLISESRSRKVIPFSISAGTDNRANEFLSVKRSTTKLPLMLINMQLSHVLASSSLLLNLQWRAREENLLADALTNEDDSSFFPSLRINVNSRFCPLQSLTSCGKQNWSLMNARHHLSLVRFPEGNAKRPNGDSRSAFLANLHLRHF